MANHVQVNEGLKRARDLIDAVRKVQQGIDELKRQQAVMVQKLDGDGTQNAHFALHAELYGTAGIDADAKQAKARTMYNELNSTVGNLHASLTQFLAIMG